MVNEDLEYLLLRHLYAGTLRVEQVRPALSLSLPPDHPPLAELHDLLQADANPALCELRNLVFQRMMGIARRCHANKRSVEADSALFRDLGLPMNLPNGWAQNDRDAAPLAEIRQAFWAAEAQAERREILDLAFAWPDQRVAPTLIELCQDEWAQSRCMLMLALRFGRWDCSTWKGAAGWLDDQERLRRERMVVAPEPAPVPKPQPLPVPKRQPPPLPSPTPIVIEAPEPTAGATPDPPEPKPNLWATHIQPLLHENWYLVVGVIMVIIGASLLAYYTWDRHWLMRYTIMPTLLLGLTVAFAEIGGWLARRFDELRGTATIMRVAAIGLLPINVMAIALLSRDSTVAAANKTLALPSMALVYLVIFGWGLRRWCKAEEAPTASPFCILGLNAIIPLGAAAPLISIGGGALPLFLAGMLHLGFFLVAGIMRRSQAQLFVAGVLLLSFGEVFAWAHWLMRIQPQADHYALLTILAGGLAFELQRQHQRYSGALFVGYALVILGLLMGISEPHLRIAVLLLAGAAWLYQATFREEPIHHWIGLTLLALGGAAIGILPDFPRDLLAPLGLGIALLIGLIRAVARRSGNQILCDSATEFQPIVLFLTAVVSVLSQWHFRSLPITTGLTLVVISGIFAARAYVAERLGWVHATMAMLALAMPYFGCVDMIGHSLHGNTLIFGFGVLSLVWLLTVRLANSALLRDARSTVLFSYGALATTALLVRVFLERGRPSVFVNLDMVGPILMSVALALAAWHSRSMLPGILAAAIMAVLFPELKQTLQDQFPMFGWGSGIGSAISATILCLLAIPIARNPRLAALDEGDRFNGRTLFPLQRRDAGLFTIPMLGTAIFLCGKVMTWNLAISLNQHSIGGKSAAAFALVGLCWMLIFVRIRHRQEAQICPHLGWISFFVSIAILCGFDGHSSFPEWPWAMVWTGLLLQTLSQVRPLARPANQGLLACSMVMSAIICLLLIYAEPRPAISALLVFVALQLTRHKRKAASTLLFVLSYIGLLAHCSPGGGDLVSRLGVEHALTPSLIFAVAILLLRGKLSGDRFIPWQAGAILISLVVTGLALGDVLLNPPVTLTVLQLLLVGLLLALAARQTRSGGFLLAILLLAFLHLHADALAEFATLGQRLTYLALPLRAAGLMMALALAGLPLREARVWFFAPALALALRIMASDPLHFHQDPQQLWAFYLAALATWVTARTWRTALYHASALILTLANIRLVFVLFDSTGLSSWHLLAIGLALTMLQALPLPRHPAITRGNAGLAGTILLLLGCDYLLHSDIAALTSARLLVSGLLAFGAGHYFRALARGKQLEDEWRRRAAVCYHVGITIAIWCLLLLIPQFRTPQLALYALAIAPLYFYLRAETSGKPYRDSASLLIFAIFALYVLKVSFDEFLFPNADIGGGHYHYNAPLVVLLSLLLFRLRALGGGDQLAHFGGIGLITGTFFTLGWLPALSPFDYPLHAAGLGIALTHLFMWRRKADPWAQFRLVWDSFLLVGVHTLVLLAFFDLGDPQEVAPLLAGLATLWARQKRWGIAAGLALIALHMDFLLPSYLPKEWVVAVLLGLWALVILARPIRRSPLVAALILAHILWHGPDSRAGLLAMLVMGLILALTPRPAAEREEPALGLLVIPPWLVYFLLYDGDPVARLPWLFTIATVLAIGQLARSCELRKPAIGNRLLHQAQRAMARPDLQLPRVFLITSTILLSALMVMHYPEPFSAFEILLTGTLWLLMAGLHWRASSYGIAEFAVLAMTVVARQQLLLHHPGVWTPEYDVWAGLALSMCVTAGKQVIDARPEAMRRPYMLSLFAMPVLVLGWVLFRDLGTDISLVVLLLYSAMFAFLGRDSGSSRYNIVAVSGFVAFVLLLFANKLELRVLHAYVIPTGLGVLALVQLFRRKMSRELATQIRAVTLLAMLGSTAYCALLDDRYPLAFHTTMLLLSLGAMACGSFFRVRVFLLFGACGVLVDLCSVFYKIVVRLERPYQMTSIGVLILVIGIALVACTAYYKTQREAVEGRLNRMRAVLGDWE